VNAHLKSVLKGAVIAVVGALLTYIAQELGNWDFGPTWTPIIVAGFSILANIIRKALEAWQAGKAVKILVVAPLALAFALAGAPARASNLAPSFSSGPTIPFFTVRFDSIGQHGGAHGGMLAAGAGYSFNWNFLPNDSGSIRKLTVGVPVFARFQGGDPSKFAFTTGVTVGTLNNLVALGFAADLADLTYGGNPKGLLTGDVSRENFMVLVAFGINLGMGQPSAATSVRAGLAEAIGGAPNRTPPPNYVKFW